MKTAIVGGALSGNIVIESLPGPSRVVLDLDYSGIDAAALARAYPWDKKYRVFSNLTGTLNGWFEGKAQELRTFPEWPISNRISGGHRSLVPLPLAGSTEYEIRPGQARVANADVRFYSTTVRANGLIHETTSDLKVVMNSSNLKDLAFVYSNANGRGSFDGTLSGPIARPLLDGQFTLQNHVHRDWTIQNAAGGIELDTSTEKAELRKCSNYSRRIAKYSSAAPQTCMDRRLICGFNRIGFTGADSESIPQARRRRNLFR